MKKVLFICLGNICRSPMAEFVFKDIVDKAGKEKDYYVCSRATSDEEEGNPVYPPARAQLSRRGISCDGKFARQLQKKEYEEYDLFVRMEDSNVRNTLHIFGGDPDKKVVKLLDFTEEKGNIADPYFTGDFDLTYRQIAKGCAGLFSYLEK